MPRISFSDTIGIAGIVLAVVLIVLDKAGKLKGHWLFILLGLAAFMTLFIALGNSWVMDSPDRWRLWRGGLLFCFVVFAYSGIALWISPARPTERGEGSNAEIPAKTVEPVPLPPANVEANPVEMPRPPHTPQKPPTLLDLFSEDFPDTLKLSSEINLTRESDGEPVPIKRKVYLDFAAKTKFVGFYISSPNQFSDETFKICQILIGIVQPTINDLKSHQAWGGYRGQGNTGDELVFSGRVFLYYEGQPLSITQQADLIMAYKAKGYDVQFRDLTYAGDKVAAWHEDHDRASTGNAKRPTVGAPGKKSAGAPNSAPSNIEATEPEENTSALHRPYFSQVGSGGFSHDEPSNSVYLKLPLMNNSLNSAFDLLIKMVLMQQEDFKVVATESTSLAGEISPTQQTEFFWRTPAAPKTDYDMPPLYVIIVLLYSSKPELPNPQYAQMFYMKWSGIKGGVVSPQMLHLSIEERNKLIEKLREHNLGIPTKKQENR